MLPKKVRIVEVSPRDGLQNEKRVVPAAVKIALIDRLGQAGLKTIEATSFVSPRRMPQMADAAVVMANLPRRAGVRYAALVPNQQGFEQALAAGVDEIAVFAAASETFSLKNINCSIAESLERFGPIAKSAGMHHVRVRGYISCVVGCPYEGKIAPAAVAELAAQLADMGCEEISLGDTLGVGTPAAVQRMLKAVAKRVPIERLAGHFHDTYGMALANIYASLETGVAVFDASVAGLGGCPFAVGATGNVATEDVVYLMNGLGIETGINLERLVDTGAWICAELGREPASKVALALLARRNEP